MPTTQPKSLDQLRVEVGDHIDTARREAMAAAKIADRMAMRRTHHHCLAAVSHLDDSLALLAETE